MINTNYTAAFILVSADTKAKVGRAPKNSDSVAGVQFEILNGDPYRYTSDDLIFEVYARRHKISSLDRSRVWAEFSQKSHPCLRASPLVKIYGWGVHHNADSRVALVGMETELYRRLSSDSSLTIWPGMRSRRA